jgi:putative acetyltransferase
MANPPDVTLRPAAADDADALAAVHARAIAALDAAHYTAAERAAWSARMDPAKYRALLASRRITVAETVAAGRQRIVGYAQLLPDEGVVEGVYVDPAFGRRGVGAALVGALEEQARALGLPGLVLDAALHAVPFYRSLGYRQECLSRHELAPGVHIACAVMEKRLGAAADEARR